MPGAAPCPGGVCVAGACFANDRCVGSGQAVPDAGTVCRSGTLVACGGVNQPCCANNACPDAGAGGGCCIGARCAAPTTSCFGAGVASVCAAGACGNCGGQGQSCCSGANQAADFCTGSGLACTDNGTCGACGGAGQPCCENNVCANGGCCDQSQFRCVANGDGCGGAGTCSNGSCAAGACGALGQPRCQNGYDCTAPFTVREPVLGNTCVACGGNGQPCCEGQSGSACGLPFTCGPAGRCVPCGGPGERCCYDRSCGTGLSCSAAFVCQ